MSEKVHVSEKELNKNLRIEMVLDPMFCSGLRRWLMVGLVRLGIWVGGMGGVDVSDGDRALFMDEWNDRE
jgi:hypothetical protein